MPLNTKAIDEIPPRFYSEFSCGVEELDTYLHRYAKNNHKKSIGKTFLLLEEEQTIGFYTVSMASVDFNKLPDKIMAGHPKYPVPVARIGRLAVDKKYKSKGFGKFLLMDALTRIFDASRAVAAYAILVDAKNLDVAKFYERFGFEASKDNPLCLFLSIATVSKLIAE
jgi:GNAT superfamily N-acetyltransferase